jgi:hypothetical protein
MINARRANGVEEHQSAEWRYATASVDSWSGCSCRAKRLSLSTIVTIRVSHACRRHMSMAMLSQRPHLVTDLGGSLNVTIRQ